MCLNCSCLIHLFFFNDTATTEIYTLSLHDALPISYRSVEEVRAFEAVPILSTIPRIVTERDRVRTRRLQRLSTAAVAVGLLAVVTSSFAFAHNNHGFVAMLSFEPPPA